MTQSFRMEFRATLFAVAALLSTAVYATDEPVVQLPVAEEQATPLYASEAEISLALSKVDVIDPRLIMFTTPSAAGSACMIDFHKSSKKIKAVFCKSYSKNITRTNKVGQKSRVRNIHNISKARDLTNLLPVREITYFPLHKAIKFDVKYPGHRSNLLDVGLENIFKFVGMYPDMHYQGTLMIDEYKKGLPFKISTGNAEEFIALLSYFADHLLNDINQLPKPEQRPLLLVDCVEGLEPLSEPVIQLLHLLFVVADPKLQSVKDFYTNITDSFDDAMAVECEARGGTFAENFLDKIDKETSGCGGKDLAVKAAMIVAGYLIIKRFDKWVDAVNKKYVDQYDPVLTTIGKPPKD